MCREGSHFSCLNACISRTPQTALTALTTLSSSAVNPLQVAGAVGLLRAAPVGRSDDISRFGWPALPALAVPCCCQWSAFSAAARLLLRSLTVPWPADRGKEGPREGKLLHVVDFGSGAGNATLAVAWLLKDRCRFTLLDMKPTAVRRS